MQANKVKSKTSPLILNAIELILFTIDIISFFA
jgi:hypothetical protein